MGYGGICLKAPPPFERRASGKTTRGPNHGSMPIMERLAHVMHPASQKTLGAVNMLPHDQASSAEQTRWFTEEVHPHEPSLRAYLNGSFPTVRDLDDVVQESYLRIWKARAAYPIGSARAFLFTVARRLALDVIRKDRRSVVDSSGDLAAIHVYEDRPLAAEALGQHEKVQLLIRAIDSLPPRCREIVILRKIKLIPQREVALQLRISEKGVENLLARGLIRCRDFLRKRGLQNLFGDESRHQ